MKPAKFQLHVRTADGREFDVERSYADSRSMVFGLQETVEYVDGTFVGYDDVELAPAPESVEDAAAPTVAPRRTTGVRTCSGCGATDHDLRKCKGRDAKSANDMAERRALIAARAKGGAR